MPVARRQSHKSPIRAAASAARQPRQSPAAGAAWQRPDTGQGPSPPPPLTRGGLAGGQVVFFWIDLARRQLQTRHTSALAAEESAAREAALAAATA